MTIEGWIGFQTGLMLTFVFIIIMIIYYRLRGRLERLERFVKQRKREVKDEKGKPKDV